VKWSKVLFNNCIFAFACAIILVLSIDSADYLSIGQHYIHSLPMKASGPALEKDKTGHDIKVLLPHKKVLLQDRDKLEIVINIFAKQNKNFAINDATLVLLKDLEVIVGNAHHPEHSLLSIFDRTVTTFGKIGLLEIISQPISRIDDLINRQSVIKKLVNDQELFDQLEQLLANVKRAEHSLFEYWQQEHREVTNIINKVYWNSRMIPSFFNKNAFTMELGVRLDNAATALKVSLPFLVMAAIDSAEQYITGQHIDVQAVLKNVAHGCGLFIDPRLAYENYKNIGSDKAWASFSSIYSKQGLPVPFSRKVFNRIGYVGCGLDIGIKIGTVAFYGHTIKKAIGEAVEHQHIINFLHKNLIDVATIVNAVEDVRSLIERYDEVAQGLVYFEYDNTFYATDEYKTLINLLSKNTFKGAPSVFSFSGRVLAAHTLMKESKKELSQSLQLLAELDACLAIAKVYKEHAATSANKAAYCFVEYKECDTPYMHLEHFWNPFIPAHSAITNTITLDSVQLPQAVILTGSNTGGKSTLLKAILINLLLAQTCGIAAAQKAIITPFAHLGSSLNITDNTAEGQSLFQAEIDRSKSIVNAIDGLPLKNFAFFGIDELFTGTAVEKGQAAAINMVRYLASKKSCLFIFATHFSEVTKLEQETAGICKNMKMEAFIKNNSIVRLFKLEDGISCSSVANHMLQNQLSEITQK
jgi:hypothetical protein